MPSLRVPKPSTLVQEKHQCNQCNQRHGGMWDWRGQTAKQPRDTKLIWNYPCTENLLGTGKVGLFEAKRDHGVPCAVPICTTFFRFPVNDPNKNPATWTAHVTLLGFEAPIFCGGHMSLNLRKKKHRPFYKLKFL